MRDTVRTCNLRAHKRGVLGGEGALMVTDNHFALSAIHGRCCVCRWWL